MGLRVEVVRVVEREDGVREVERERGRGGHRVVRLAVDDVAVHLGLERRLDLAHLAGERDAHAEAETSGAPRTPATRSHAVARVMSSCRAPKRAA